MNSKLPSGTVTFLFTDIESSTRLWEQYPEEMKPALAKHDSILKQAVESNHGYIIKTTGDGVHAVFGTAIDSVMATLLAQHSLHQTADRLIRVRMGLHTGEAELRDGDYYGSCLNRAARIMSVAHGGQVLLSETTAQVVREHLPADTTLFDLGKHHLKGLLRPENIFQLVAPGLQKDFPPLNSIPTATNNLPTQLTSFVGRQKEISEIIASLNSSHLVTLTGSGGTGKTRLSIEVGTQLLPNFANGVWIVELAPLSDPAQILPALAQVFRLQESVFKSLEDLITDYLREKKLLLLLDNCEHLIAACAKLADDLLRQSAGLKILASSREALGIAGEVAYRVPSLADSESTRLFVDRARAANSKFSLTDSNASPVAKICRRLDGIPLAIELAAARTKLLSPEQIASRLDDLFRLLVGGSRTALPRQQTLRALIDWSYDMLSDEEKQLLRTASAFMGGWTLEALEAISEDPNAMENLEGLVSKSLVVTEERNDEMRYFMLETIRQYAREKLFEARQAAAARDRHFLYFNELSKAAWSIFLSMHHAASLNRLNDEIENLRAALEWGLENHIDEAIHLAANFCIILRWMGKPGEGMTFAQSAVERVRALPPAADETVNMHRQKSIAQALFAQVDSNIALGNTAFAAQAAKEAIAISRVTGDKKILGYTLVFYAFATLFIQRIWDRERESAAKEGLDIFSKEVNDSYGLGLAYLNLASIAAMRGDEIEKNEFIGKLKKIANEAPDSFQTGLFFLSLGMLENANGNYEAAKQIFEDGQDIFKRIGNIAFQQVLQSELGHVARHTGKLGEAKTIYGETIRSWQDSGNRGAIANQLECFAFISITEEEALRAARLFGAAEALREKSQTQMTDNERVEYDRYVAQLRAMLTEAEFNRLWADGKSMTMEQAIQLALVS